MNDSRTAARAQTGLCPLATATVADEAGGVARYPTDCAFTLTLAYVAAACVASVLVTLTLMLPKRSPPAQIASE